MTKEELIELSDLNREDNVKFISSEAQGIAIALDSDIYTPTLCKLERAYICGRRKSEKQIDELKKENTELKAKNKWYSEQVCNKECAEVWGNLTKATDLLKWFVWYFREGSPNLVPYKHKVAETEQFISEVEK